MRSLPQTLERCHTLIELQDEEIARLRQLLGFADSASRLSRLMQTWSISWTEARVLLRLLEANGKTVTRQALHFYIYGQDPDGGRDPKSFDVVIYHLRGKLAKRHAPPVIQTIRQVGWQIARGDRAQIELVADADPVDCRTRDGGTRDGGAGA